MKNTRIIIFFLLSAPMIFFNLLVSAIVYIIIKKILQFDRFKENKKNPCPKWLSYWEHILKSIEKTYCPFEHTNDHRKFIAKKYLLHHKQFYSKSSGQKFYGKIRKDIMNKIPYKSKRFLYDFVGNVIFLYLPTLTLFILYTIILNFLFFGISRNSLLAHIRPDRYNLSQKMQLRERWFCFYCDLATGILSYYKELYIKTN